ncbi:hypothetical protein SUGI_0236500 [Cryptomeria japonica]|nr:hypothetical protein SUGI_0236500 [Cryptomeria japonica]
MASLTMLTRSFACTTSLLCVTFYANSCPQALSIVNNIVQQAVNEDKRMGASLLRLHFHDCFVNGCDASVLLDDNPNFESEKGARPNQNSLRGFDVIDNIKTQLENVCREVVSCADILAIATRDSVVQLGGPSWEVMLGRRDSRVPNKTAANEDIPSPFLEFSGLQIAFQKQGLSVKDLIALSGAHTIGQAQCFTFRNRTSTLFLPNLFRQRALETMALAVATFLLSTLLTQMDATFIQDEVALYSNDQTAFFTDFQVSMVNMGNIKPLTGTDGEVRKDCRKPN